MTKIAFFGHDAGDAAIRRRVAAFTAAGCSVTGFMMRRDENIKRGWINVDLGQTYDAAYWQRLWRVFKGAGIAGRHAKQLRQADLIYARNLDMLICAMLVKRRLKLSTPVVYECLDVHHLLTQNGPVGLLMRGLERRLLASTRLLVFSSPAFEREFFKPHYDGRYTPYLLENRLVTTPQLPMRPAKVARRRVPLRVGWFGVLRCHRSLVLLQKLAIALPNEVEVITAGLPAKTQVPDFTERVEAVENMSHLGPYQAPQDLQGLYEKVDLIWAGDFYQAGFNSKWLLPNRLYEGGYFSVPAIAPLESETGNWVEAHKTGCTVSEPIEENLITAVQSLLSDPTPIENAVHNLQSLPESVLIQPDDEISKLIELALSSKQDTA